MAASGEGSVDQRRFSQHSGNWFEQSAEVKDCQIAMPQSQGGGSKREVMVSFKTTLQTPSQLYFRLSIKYDTFYK
jgi:hypothetical protein